MKKKIIVLIVTGLFYFNQDKSATINNKSTVIDQPVKLQTEKLAKKVAKAKNGLKADDLRVAQELFALLQPPSREELEENWLEEYRCHNYRYGENKVVTLYTMDRGDNTDAMRFAASVTTFSDKSKTYPHVLYIPEYFVAGLLGDSYAYNSGITNSANKMIVVHSIENAHRYLNQIFGSQQPKATIRVGNANG
jgi:hypothetical protein